jgi:porin
MVRVRLRPSKAFTLMAAVFNGDPAGPGTGDPQLRDRSGTAFRLHDHGLTLVEGGCSAGSEGEDGLPGTYKLGVLRHAGRFSDPRLDKDGAGRWRTRRAMAFRCRITATRPFME